MSKSFIQFDDLYKIINNEQFDESFRSLLELAFITGLRRAEIVRLINELRKDKYAQVISFKGKRNITIDVPLNTKHFELVNKINNNWANGSSLAKQVQRWNIKYDLNIELHSIRRLSATTIDKNLDVRHAQSLLNHKDLATTELYIHESNKMNRKIHAMNLLEKSLQDGTTNITTYNELKLRNTFLEKENEELRKRIYEVDKK